MKGDSALKIDYPQMEMEMGEGDLGHV